jgi:hypothetical protein
MTTYIYYVYAYLRTDGTPYYIGKGKDYRAYKKSHNVAVPKDKDRIIFIAKNLSEYDAFALEMFFIAWYGRKNIETGILRNLTNGGEGGSGAKIVMTDDHKKKLSLAKIGTHRPEETKRKIIENSSRRKSCTDGVNIFLSLREMARFYNMASSAMLKRINNKSKKFENFEYC